MLREDNGRLKSDSVKFQKILNQYEARKKKLIATIATEKAGLAAQGEL